MRGRLLFGFLLAASSAGGALAQAPKPAAAEGEIAALILAGEEGTLSSQMAGRISSIKVGLGDGFKKGAALIEFDCSEQRAQLQAADAEYRGAARPIWHVCACRRSAPQVSSTSRSPPRRRSARAARSTSAVRRWPTARCGRRSAATSRACA